MSKLEELIEELCPDGVEYKKTKEVFTRIKGTPITAGKMKEIASDDGDVRVFAGGKTVIDAFEKDIPNANITRVPAVLVQSRGVIDVVFYEQPFTFKNEMWAYTHKERTMVKFLYYVLKDNIQSFRDAASGMGSLPQISLPVTEDFTIPIPPLPVQEEIVRILDNFTDLTAELQAELQARAKQYDYYKNNVLSDIEGKTVKLKNVIKSLHTGLNPRKFFVLNTDDATNYYVTIREFKGGYLHFNEKTDMINDEALRLCNNRSDLEVGDMLFSGTGTIGETLIIEEEPYNWNIKEGVYSIKPDASKVDVRYLRHILTSQNMKDTYEAISEGGTVKSISMKKMEALEFILPNLDEQRRIADLLDRFDILCNDINTGLPAEIEARQKQYEYYRNKLLTFKELGA